MKIIVVRHGRTEWNDERRLSGVTDVPLTAEGRRQADELADALADSGIDLVISSPLQRALDTGRPTAQKLGVPMLTEPCLAERVFGELEGLTYEEANLKWLHKQFVWRPKGGESILDMAARIYPFLDELPRKYPGKTVLLVCHSATARCVYTYFESMDNDAFSALSTANTSVRTFDMADDARGGRV